MPKLEPKIVQRELEQGQLWPVYWLYGGERMKSRELLRRIRRAALGESAEPGADKRASLSLNEESFDGTETAAATILDAAQSPALGGGLRFIVVREAHAVKEAEILLPLLLPRANDASELTSVCVFLSKDLDGRKKFSKQLVEKAAVVPCEEVAETEREAWIGYLAKRRGSALAPDVVARLIHLEPWSLDIVDLELEKLALAEGSDVLLGSLSQAPGSEQFLDAFFGRDHARALQCAGGFADKPEEALPLLGLFAWNVRQLALILADRQRGTRSVKLNPYVAERLQAWSRRWKLEEILALQAELGELDFALKQTPLLPLGLWTGLVSRFRCAN